jgi:hypothetical protein
MSVALFVPLFFFWTLHCLSFCSSFGRCIVCPFVLLLDVALFVLLFFFWTLHCLSLCSSFEKGQTMQRPKEEQKDKQCNVQKKNRGTNNATSKRRTEGQTMQRPKEEQRDKQCNVQKKNKGTNNGTSKRKTEGQTMQRPLFFFWTLHCLYLCSSFGRCIVCPSVRLLDVALFVPLFSFWTLHCLSLCSSFERCIVCLFVLLLDVALKKNKGTDNATFKRRIKGQTMQRPKEEQRDKQCNVQKKNKETNSLSLCSSFGRCIVCPFVHLLDVALFVPLFFFWTLHCLSLCSSFGR